jgi:tungstate transport system substrate-binding protein
MFRRPLIAAAAALATVMTLPALPAAAQDDVIIVASTTSTEASGLFGHILPMFEEETGIDVRVVAKGTGQAIEMARRGDADVLFVHHRPSEEQFVDEGFGLARHDVMYNDFVVVGPQSDPAGIAGSEDAAQALAAIAETEAPFASRGDDSGTHKKEMELWDAAGVDPTDAGSWYRPLGSGMGATLNTATEMGAYALTDRGTWLSHQNRGDLEILVEGDDRLFNPYGVIVVDPDRFDHVNVEAGQRFVDWLVSDEGQQAIASFSIDGQQLFFPNADGGSGS